MRTISTIIGPVTITEGPKPITTGELFGLPRTSDIQFRVTADNGTLVGVGDSLGLAIEDLMQAVTYRMHVAARGEDLGHE